MTLRPYARRLIIVVLLCFPCAAWGDDPTFTDTPTETPTSTPTSTPTDTPTVTPTRTPTNTPTSTSTPVIILYFQEAAPDVIPTPGGVWAATNQASARKLGLEKQGSIAAATASEVMDRFGEELVLILRSEPFAVTSNASNSWPLQITWGARGVSGTPYRAYHLSVRKGTDGTERCGLYSGSGGDEIPGTPTVLQQEGPAAGCNIMEAGDYLQLELGYGNGGDDGDEASATLYTGGTGDTLLLAGDADQDVGNVTFRDITPFAFVATSTPTPEATATRTATPVPTSSCCDCGIDANCVDPETLGWACPEGCTVCEQCECAEIP